MKSSSPLIILAVALALVAFALPVTGQQVVPSDTIGNVQSVEFVNTLNVQISAVRQAVGGTLCKLITIKTVGDSAGSVRAKITTLDGKSSWRQLALKAGESLQLVLCGHQLDLPSGLSVERAGGLIQSIGAIGLILITVALMELFFRLG